MKKKTKPVSTWETVSRGSGDPLNDMKNNIKPNFTTGIKDTFNSLEDDLQNDIKKVYTHYITQIENCGEVVFGTEWTEDDYDRILDDFEGMDSEAEKKKFVDLFYELNILES